MKYRMSMTTFALTDRCRGAFREDCRLEIDNSMTPGAVLIEEDDDGEKFSIMTVSSPPVEQGEPSS